MFFWGGFEYVFQFWFAAVVFVFFVFVGFFCIFISFFFVFPRNFNNSIQIFFCILDPLSP